MYNLYRWYPTGKVIFMAPTRPLVNQQIEACYKIMGIPKEDTAEMTGKQLRKNRSELWQTKRVFYVTPQVILADINSPEQNFPTDSIKLVVIDEAHKAKGRYAYTEVIKAISATNKQFRVLALSATPGRTLEDVAEVLRNLLISHIEVRWENSIDVSPYTFKKNIRTVVIPLGPTLSQIRDRYIELIDPYVRRLMDANVISHTRNLSSGWLVMEQKRFREACLIQRHPNYTAINSDFSAGMSMYHAMELLVRHGVRAFLNFFEDDSGSKPEEKFFVAKDLRLKAFLDELREEYGRNPLAIFNNVGAPMPNGVVPRISADEKIDFGHPKFAILERHLREHFENHPDSKVIVFCEFRDSVAMIQRLLLQNRPLVKPKCIVGQGGTAGGLRAVTQKEQIAAMVPQWFINGTKT
ncbi:Fanconi anemia group M protein-like [Uranotaenia lowii]|uniref:Fanconi anemia group M protein-like n=1 Tax=Uranotaenia lowii TaxID=190385 RepID=UPI00247875CA|nr:Fanconi anemia group M protein-like [Uranotaenia lowii]XP_055593291.1 Fanconi anemia group M protein-like [Uranotaenia lowii]XP_055593293.1 Fanconi anemia group M protein-like [Uranotaenia lowii]